MSSERRDSYRADAPFTAHAATPRGNVQVEIEDVSVSGTRLSSTIRLDPGLSAELHVHLDPDLQREFHDVDAVYPIEILTAELGPHRTWILRCRNMVAPGSHEERVVGRLVGVAQRRTLAARSGADEASPMASDAERRAAHRHDPGQRYGRSSLYPHLSDDQ